MKKAVRDELAKKAKDMLEKACIKITNEEFENMDISDLGLGRPYEIGAQIVVYINNDIYCAKEIVMLPHQIVPEHYHPPIKEKNYPGKTETFRCRWGIVYLYVPGEPTPNPKAKVPEDKKQFFTVWHEIILKPGEQYTIPPNTKHWFQAGPEGAIVSEFSSTSYDEYDVFTDPNIVRIVEVEE
jgi:D-lyxose ketol-isomerase